MKLEAAITKKRARIEMIPLIDCVFIVLVFFIYAMLAMTLRRGIEVQLPLAAELQATADDAVVVTITAEGDFLVNDERVSLEELRGAIRREGGPEGPPRVLINADTAARHGWVVRVMDELRAEGVSHVVILSDKRRDQ